MSIDLDPLARAVDPKRLSISEYVGLFETIAALVRTGALPDLTSLATPSLARLLLRASREQLDAALGGPAVRALVLDEVFRRLPAQLNRQRAASTDAVLLVELTDSVQAQRFQLRVTGAHCAVGWSCDRTPDVTLTASAPDFLRLALSPVNAAVLLARRRVSVRGELGVAVRVLRSFDAPKL